MEKNILFIVLIISCLWQIRAQNTFFTKTYGDYYTNIGVDVAEISKNQFLVLGNSSIQDYTYNPVLFLLGDTGQIVKKAEFFSSSIYKANSLMVGQNAYYISGITNDSQSNDYQAFLMKIDTAFNQVWVKSFGHPEIWDEATSMIGIGNRIFVGVNSYETENLEVMASVFEFSENGDSLNCIHISLDYSAELKKLSAFSDSVLTFSGAIQEYTDSSFTAMIGEINLHSEEVNIRTYRTVLEESMAHGFCKTSSGYAVCGSTQKFFDFSNRDGYVLLLNDSMNYVFDMIISDIYYNQSDEFFDIVQDFEGNLMTAGRTESFGAGNFDILLYKFNSGAWFLWSATIGSDRYDIGAKVICTQDSSYLAVGETTLYGVNNQDVLVAKVSKEMQLDSEISHVTSLVEADRQLSFRYTNPVVDFCQIYFEESLYVKMVKIVGSDGRLVSELPIHNYTNKVSLNLGFLNSGLYFLIIETDSSRLNGKVLKVE